MHSVTLLPSTETDIDRDFTRLIHHHDDLQVLSSMVARLLDVLAVRPWPPRQLVDLPDPSGRAFTLLVNHPEPVVSAPELTIVGFFGDRNPDATPAERQALWTIDDQLIEEIADHPGVLSLSCRELEDGNYGNLVVLANAEAAEHWRTSATHQRAVRDHAPRYYRSIRIHNGALADGVLCLTRTKYYDFRAPGPWFAQRDLVPALTGVLEKSFSVTR